MPRVGSDPKITPSKSAQMAIERQLAQANGEANGAAAAADATPAPSPLGPSRRGTATGDGASASGSTSGSPEAAAAPPPAHQRSSSMSGLADEVLLSPGGSLPRRPSSGVVTGQRRQVEQELIYEKLPADIADRYVLLMDPILGSGRSASRAIQVGPLGACWGAGWGAGGRGLARVCRSGGGGACGVVFAHAHASRPLPPTRPAVPRPVPPALQVLLERGVAEHKILFLTVIAAPEGIRRICGSYPRLRVLTSEIDEGMEDFHVVPGALGAGGAGLLRTGRWQWESEARHPTTADASPDWWPPACRRLVPLQAWASGATATSRVGLGRCHFAAAGGGRS